MTESLVASKRNRSKVKTGCTTCRIRKVKCDEIKPFCHKCIKTGRTCDGYESPFRFFTNEPINSRQPSGTTSPEPIWPTIEIASKEIDLLNRYFHTKTLFDVKLSCDEEAKQVLQASLADPAIRQAISSLKALREDLEISGDDPDSVKQTPNYQYGIQQYSVALMGLASNLSSSNGVRSALLCCQVFISIEQLQKSYTAMAQHIIQGLRIMHEYRARPCLLANKLVPAHHEQLPYLDVFIIKLFVAPCNFAEPLVKTDESGTVSPKPPVSCDLPMIAPDVRTKLTKIGSSTIEFLERVSQVKSVEIARKLQSEKAALLESLESWLIDLENIEFSGSEPIRVSFLRYFHRILKMILMGTLNSSPDLDIELRTEEERLQQLAYTAGERVKTYITSIGTSGVRV